MLAGKSWFSLRFGTLSIENLLDTFIDLDFSSVVLTDINTTSGCLDFVRIAKERGLKPVIGVEFRKDFVWLYSVLAADNSGFEAINRLLSSHLTDGVELPDEVPEIGNVFVVYPPAGLPQRSLHENEFIGLSPSDLKRTGVFSSFSRSKAILFHRAAFTGKQGYNIHRLLRSVDRNTLLSKLLPEHCASHDECFISQKELIAAFATYPDLISRTFQILDKCHVDFEFGKSKNKTTFTGSSAQDFRLLEQLSSDGLRYRYGSGNREAERRLKHELQVIDKLGFTSYFLITEDLIRYARHRGFYHVGRGSGANSIAAYCLRITDVDPIELDLYFERFINPFRTSPPDFDLDFSWRDRDDVLNYMFQRYGREHTALMATYTTFQRRAVVRELGKVFGLPKTEIDVLSDQKVLPPGADHIASLVFKYGGLLHGFPNHLGIHAGGVLISEAPIFSYTATQMPPKGFPITQFDMYVAEELGLYKYDVLSQRGLGHIRDAVDLVLENRQISVDIHRVSDFKRDREVKELIRTGRSMGCFYVESPAMRMLLSKLKCEDYVTLVAASFIIHTKITR
ncbi:MAG: PHP domain-containing protein, partial [Bacteroidetes bacterium]|nr:PHP domain-containing protein [Bacteroidota bacterium]